MAIVTMILGNSGEGKSYSLKHIDPSICTVINVMNKPLPFANGKNFTKFATDNAEKIKQALIRLGANTAKDGSPKTPTPIIVIDDFQYIMGNQFIKGAKEQYKGDAAFQRYNELAYNAWSVIDTAINQVPNDCRVYILAHTQDNNGRTSIKTIGKMLDEKIVLEGMVTTVLQTQVNENGRFFMTQNNGFNTVKSPEGMFESDLIPNDLNLVDDAICEYYGLSKTLTETQPTPEVA